MGSLFSRSSSKAPNMTSAKKLSMRVDPSLLTITNDSSEPLLNSKSRRLGQQRSLSKHNLNEKSTLPHGIDSRTKSIGDDVRVRTMKVKRPTQPCSMKLPIPEIDTTMPLIVTPKKKSI